MDTTRTNGPANLGITPGNNGVTADLKSQRRSVAETLQAILANCPNLEHDDVKLNWQSVCRLDGSNTGYNDQLCEVKIALTRRAFLLAEESKPESRDEIDFGLAIGNFDVDLKQQTLWQKIKEFLTQLFRHGNFDPGIFRQRLGRDALARVEALAFDYLSDDDLRKSVLNLLVENSSEDLHSKMRKWLITNQTFLRDLPEESGEHDSAAVVSNILRGWRRAIAQQQGTDKGLDNKMDCYIRARYQRRFKGLTKNIAEEIQQAIPEDWRDQSISEFSRKLTVTINSLKSKDEILQDNVNLAQNDPLLKPVPGQKLGDETLRLIQESRSRVQVFSSNAAKLVGILQQLSIIEAKIPELGRNQNGWNSQLMLCSRDASSLPDPYGEIARFHSDKLSNQLRQAQQPAQKLLKKFLKPTSSANRPEAMTEKSLVLGKGKKAIQYTSPPKEDNGHWVLEIKTQGKGIGPIRLKPQDTKSILLPAMAAVDKLTEKELKDQLTRASNRIAQYVCVGSLEKQRQKYQGILNQLTAQNKPAATIADVAVGNEESAAGPKVATGITAGIIALPKGVDYFVFADPKEIFSEVEFPMSIQVAQQGSYVVIPNPNNNREFHISWQPNVNDGERDRAGPKRLLVCVGDEPTPACIDLAQSLQQDSELREKYLALPHTKLFEHVIGASGIKGDLTTHEHPAVAKLKLAVDNREKFKKVMPTWFKDLVVMHELESDINFFQEDHSKAADKVAKKIAERHSAIAEGVAKAWQLYQNSPDFAAIANYDKGYYESMVKCAQILEFNKIFMFIFATYKRPYELTFEGEPQSRDLDIIESVRAHTIAILGCMTSSNLPKNFAHDQMSGRKKVEVLQAMADTNYQSQEVVSFFEALISDKTASNAFEEFEKQIVAMVQKYFDQEIKGLMKYYPRDEDAIVTSEALQLEIRQHIELTVKSLLSEPGRNIPYYVQIYSHPH